MSHHRFVWTDLSTFDLSAARRDYAALFGWGFEGDDGYDFAMSDTTPVAAVFPMPDRLAAINMPSFWMSYIHVPDVAAAVARARGHPDVIVEIAPTEFGEAARIALIRDPSGAGVTLYEGPDITPPPGPGRVMARYHHLPDVMQIRDFYADLFGWQFVRQPAGPWGAGWPVWQIRHAEGDVIAHAEEVPETVRGPFRYWMPCFVCAVSPDGLAGLGMQVQSDLGGGRKIIADQQGASLMICPA